MKFISALSLMLLCCLGTEARSEGNCPSGYYPIGDRATAGCAPIPDNGGQQQQAPSVQAPVWEDRWGAIAFDGPRGILGSSADFPIKQAAEQAALNQCKDKGGVKCQLEVSYRNGCASLTIGDRNYYRGSAATRKKVVEEGMQLCQKNDKNCETYYSDCSLPVRIR